MLFKLVGSTSEIEMTKKITINKSDYLRVLATETLPFETPIVFSSDGLYRKLTNIKNADPLEAKILNALVKGENEGVGCPYTVPFLYKVRKNSTEFRRLGLVHPRSQWKIKELYENYDGLMVHYCGKSAATIRAPKKTGSTYFIRNKSQSLNKYKHTPTITLLENDTKSKHSHTFFAYRGYDRLYKFFESREYFNLEKQYSIMTSLDVSKCFDSIYTHTLAWAVKDKPFTKQNLKNNSGTFAGDFDDAMMHSNHSETNGIVIGPEFSRIFAEIILQEVDGKCTERLLIKHGLKFGVDYKFLRYVDDVFIFSQDEKTSGIIYAEYTHSLLDFNLHTNSAKKTTIRRPFVTEKSKIIQAASKSANVFFDKFLQLNDKEKLIPKEIRSPFRLTKSFLDSIKTACSENKVGYDEISSYLISVLNERIKLIASIDPKYVTSDNSDDYINCLLVFIESMYFLYQVAPSVSSSYRICTSLIIVIRFAKCALAADYDTIASRIYELSILLLDEHKNIAKEKIDGFLPLEVINVLLATKELGEKFILPEDLILEILLANKENYFSIISFMFYVGHGSEYPNARRELLSQINKILIDLSDVRKSSEKTYLLLDMIGCPYVSNRDKRVWIKSACKALSIGGNLPNIQVDSCISAWQVGHSYINWNDLDILNALEKKELKRSY